MSRAKRPGPIPLLGLGVAIGIIGVAGPTWERERSPFAEDTAPLAITITDVNEPPTVALANTTTTFAEDTDTTSAIKVADIVITDDALGTNVLSLSGADAALFQIVGTEQGR